MVGLKQIDCSNVDAYIRVCGIAREEEFAQIVQRAREHRAGPGPARNQMICRTRWRI